MKLAAVLTGLALLVASTAMPEQPRLPGNGTVLESEGRCHRDPKGKRKVGDAKDKDTKTTGDLKVGSKGTVCTP